MKTIGDNAGKSPRPAAQNPWRPYRYEDPRYRQRHDRLQRAQRYRRDERNIQRYWAREELDEVAPHYARRA